MNIGNLFFLIYVIIVAITIFAFISVWSNFFSNTTSWDERERVMLIGATSVFAMTFLSSLASIWSTSQQKADAERLEKIKTQFTNIASKENEAYHAMWAAIAKSYRIVSETELGICPKEKIGSIEELFEEAEAISLLAKKEIVLEFGQYWQKVREIYSFAEHHEQQKQEIIEMWRREAKKLAETYDSLNSKIASEVRA